MSTLRTRWAAIGAAVAIALGAGGVGLTTATNPSTATTFVAITPCRVLDTRPAPDNVGNRNAPLGTDETHTVTAHGDNGDCAGIPVAATAISLNITAVSATLPTFLTLWAADATQPLASSLNPVPGAPPTPNAVTTELSSSGQFNIYNLQGDVEVIADINGYYVDHDHDDRYYPRADADATFATKGEVEAAADLGKSMSLDPAGFHLTSGTEFELFGGTRNTGVVLNDDDVDAVAFTATLPTDLTPGSQIRIELFWHIDEEGCSVALLENARGATRLGEVFLSMQTVAIPYIKIGTIPGDEVRRYAVETASDGGYLPGDIVKYSVYRSITNDTCTEDVVIDGGRILYD